MFLFERIYSIIVSKICSFAVVLKNVEKKPNCKNVGRKVQCTQRHRERSLKQGSSCKIWCPNEHYRNASIKRPGAYLIFLSFEGGGALIRDGRLFEGGGGLIKLAEKRSNNFVASVYRAQVFLYSAKYQPQMTRTLLKSWKENCEKKGIH